MQLLAKVNIFNITGLPHTQGIKENSGKLSVFRFFYQAQGNTGKFSIFLKISRKF